MDECIKAVHYERKKGQDLCPVEAYGPEAARKVNEYHRQGLTPAGSGYLRKV